ncbi:hypothetical protein Tco_0196961, partial [Tanacetum coccineum]
MPRGTTQVVTRGASNHCMQRWQVRGTRYEVAGTRYEVRGGSYVSTRYYSGGGWTNQRVTRGTLRVSVRGRHVSVRGQTMAIMRQLVERKKTKIP